MKLVSYGPPGRERPGVLLDENTILDIRRVTNRFSHLQAVLKGGHDALNEIDSLVTGGAKDDWLVPAHGQRFGPPVTNPSKIVCLGLNYHGHATEQNARLPKHPLLFAKAPSALAGHLDPIWYPADENNLDYEAELAFVIGRPAFRVQPEDWKQYVAGYTILNDVSARDAQWADRKWFRGKSYDSTCPVGPWIVTGDEIPDPAALRVSATLNGELRQEGHTGDLIFSIPEILAFATLNITFLPGDIISTGTPSGVGIFMDPPACMSPGDEVSVAIAKIGTLTNTVKQRKDLSPSVYPAP